MSTYLRGVEMPLPEGERLLWQGSPNWKALAIHAFHVRKIAIYFGLLLIVAAIAARGAPDAARQFRSSAMWLTLGGVTAVAFVGLVAKLAARTTLYAITERRLVMKIGIALPVVLNVPLRVIDSIAMKRYPSGHGNVAIRLEGDVRVAFAVLWPHARAWHLRHPQPLLRDVDDVAAVASVLDGAVRATLEPEVELIETSSGHAA